MHCVGAVLSTVAYPAVLYLCILPHKRHDFWKETLLIKIYVFRLSLQLLSEVFLIIGRFLVNDQRDAQILFYVFISMCNSLHVSSTTCWKHLESYK
jgi:hypothetical protein